MQIHTSECGAVSNCIGAERMHDRVGCFMQCNRRVLVAIDQLDLVVLFPVDTEALSARSCRDGRWIYVVQLARTENEVFAFSERKMLFVPVEPLVRPLVDQIRLGIGSTFRFSS